MPDERAEEPEGGESACFANLICPECGAVLDGSAHVTGCTWVDPESTPERSYGVEPAQSDPT